MKTGTHYRAAKQVVTEKVTAQRGFRLGEALSLLFFFSGIPALIYQLVWERALFRIYGINIECVTIVVTAFMLGLGFGSLAGGLISKRPRLNLLATFAAIEIATAIYGAVSLPLFEWAGERTIHWPLTTVAVMSLVLLIIPTLLMGATLPILVGHLIRRTRRVGPSLGLLYYVNTLGAGAACLLAATVLFPFLGMQKSIYVASGLNLAVAAAAVLIQRRIVAEPSSETPPVAEPRDPKPILRRSVYVLGFLSGFVALSYEIFFFRTVSYMTGSNAAAFALTLAAFLIGLAGGARASGRQAEAGRDPVAAQHFVISALRKAVVCGLLFLPALVLLPRAGHVGWAVGLVLIYMFARQLGTFLPYLAQRGIAADDRAGQHVSYLYMANILGSASGSLLTGFFLADWLELRMMSIVLALIAVGFVIVAALALTAGKPSRDFRILASGGAVVALTALHLVLPTQWIYRIQIDQFTPIVEGVENRSGIITVDTDRDVYGNGIYDGQFNVNLIHDTNDIWRAYALGLYHPNAKKVLIIGMSSGSWSQVIANAPGVESVTIVEINPGYVELVSRQPDIASLLTNPKVEVIIDDGRRWLRRNPDRKFDAVVSNTSFYFRSNATNVLSMEFMRLVADHLEPGGTFFYHSDRTPRTLRTGCTAFPYGLRIANSMIVSQVPLQLDAERWRNQLQTWQIDGKPVVDLSRSEDRKVVDWLSTMPGDITSADIAPTERRMEDCSSILERSADRQVFTDDNMGSEWRYNLGLDR
jgi:spermidine synthase